MAQILIGTLVVLLLGGILLMERRCLGKMAIVQPLVLCGLAGIITGNPEIGIWLGVSLQLLSIGQSHYCNWALAAFIVSASLLVLWRFDISPTAASPASLVLLCGSILFSIMAELSTMQLRRPTKMPISAVPIWKSQSFEVFARFIHLRMLRAFAANSLLGLSGTLVTCLLVMGIHNRVYPSDTTITTMQMVIPAFGISMTLGTLSQKRHTIYATGGLLLCFAIMVTQ